MLSQQISCDAISVSYYSELTLQAAVLDNFDLCASRHGVKCSMSVHVIYPVAKVSAFTESDLCGLYRRNENPLWRFDLKNLTTISEHLRLMRVISIPQVWKKDLCPTGEKLLGP